MRNKYTYEIKCQDSIYERAQETHTQVSRITCVVATPMSRQLDMTIVQMIYTELIITNMNLLSVTQREYLTS